MAVLARTTIACSLLLSASACGVRPARLDGLTTTTARIATVSRTVTLSGVVFPRGRTPVWPTVTGRVTKLLVSRGQAVRQGQPLLQLDTRHATLELANKELAVLRARRAITRSERLPDLVTADASLDSDLDARIASEEYDNARASLQEAREALAAHTVRSPADGIVIQANVRIGQVIMPGSVDSPSYLAIGDASGTQIEADGDEFDVSGIAAGAQAIVNIDAAGTQFDAKVVADPGLVRLRNQGLSASLYSIRLEAPNSVPASTWGMTARVTFRVATHANAIVVPQDAIVNHSDQLYVIAMEEKRPHARPVKVGLCDPLTCEVMQGVQAGTSLLHGRATALDELLNDSLSSFTEAVQ